MRNLTTWFQRGIIGDANKNKCLAWIEDRNEAARPPRHNPHLHQRGRGARRRRLLPVHRAPQSRKRSIGPSSGKARGEKAEMVASEVRALQAPQGARATGRAARAPAAPVQVDACRSAFCSRCSLWSCWRDREVIADGFRRRTARRDHAALPSLSSRPMPLSFQRIGITSARLAPVFDSRPAGVFDSCSAGDAKEPVT